MHAVILAAGEGSRMGSHIETVPKAFMDLGGRTLYDRQRAALDPHVDQVTVVLGYAYENVVDEVGDAGTVVLEDWDDYENAESLRRALVEIDDDVLVLNGDVVVSGAIVGKLVEHHGRSPRGRSAVACIPGVQEEETAIRCDERGVVTDYGMIPGHRHAGMGVVDRAHVDAAERHLRRNRTQWYPVAYTAVETEVVAIPPNHHIEINRPRDKAAAKSRLPLRSTGELDLRT
jgi:choline kinase